MHFGYNLLIPLALLLPNLLFVVLPPIDALWNEEKKPWHWTVLERAGQIGTFALPIYYEVNLDSLGKILAFLVMVLAIALYYFCWIQFFRDSKRRYSRLFQPLGFIPVPLAVSPVVYLVAASAVLESWLLLMSAICLALGHIPISYRAYRKSQT